MAYTLGAATTDRTSITLTTYGQANSVNLMMGWFYITTLTTNRRFFSGGGTTSSLDINGTNIRLTVDRLTTDATYTWSGFTLQTNMWTFLGCLLDIGTNAIPYFFATSEGNPQQIAMTTIAGTAGSGTFQSGPTWNVGNNNGVNSALQGVIGPVAWINSPAPTSNSDAIMYRATAGAMTQDEADAIKRRWVIPYFTGQSHDLALGGNTNAEVVSLNHNINTLAGTSFVGYGYRGTAGALAFNSTLPSASGAVWTEQLAPSPISRWSAWPLQTRSGRRDTCRR